MKKEKDVKETKKGNGAKNGTVKNKKNNNDND